MRCVSRLPGTDADLSAWQQQLATREHDHFWQAFTWPDCNLKSTKPVHTAASRVSRLESFGARWPLCRSPSRRVDCRNCHIIGALGRCPWFPTAGLAAKLLLNAVLRLRQGASHIAPSVEPSHLFETKVDFGPAAPAVSAPHPDAVCGTADSVYVRRGADGGAQKGLLTLASAGREQAASIKVAERARIDTAAQARSLHLTPLSGLDPSRLSIRYPSPPQVQASVAKPVGEVHVPVGQKSMPKPKQAAPRFSHLPTPLALYRVPSEAADAEEVVVPRRPAPPLPAPPRPIIAL